MEEIRKDKDNEDADDSARSVYLGRVDAYVRLGRHFEILSEADEKILGVGPSN